MEMIRMELSDEELDAVAGGKGSPSRDDSYYHNTDKYTNVGISVKDGKYSYGGQSISRASATELCYYLRKMSGTDLSGFSTSDLLNAAGNYCEKNRDDFNSDRKRANDLT